MFMSMAADQIRIENSVKAYIISVNGKLCSYGGWGNDNDYYHMINNSLIIV